MSSSSLSNEGACSKASPKTGSSSSKISARSHSLRKESKRRREAGKSAHMSSNSPLVAVDGCNAHPASPEKNMSFVRDATLFCTVFKLPGHPSDADPDRAREEDGFLARERESLHVWFAEEWTIINAAMQAAASDDDRYRFHLRREHLLRLCGTWRRKKAGRGEDGYRAPEDDETEDKEEEDFEMLDALDTADVIAMLMAWEVRTVTTQIDDL
ncbi:hypothetical protein B0H17DRAFT_1146176 [Mycena rosella]|uniref:Uncharacterized protein n=1 Tax=Mycena rosella TaxID=1033263 RepID=A0AAD7G4R8_MYCRO|nr:hypothetical protein B0H17DRAFT_1146176 [Mycena rosella]